MIIILYMIITLVSKLTFFVLLLLLWLCVLDGMS